MQRDGVAINSSQDPLFAKAVSRLRAAKRDLSVDCPQHECSRSKCNPQSELVLFPHDPLTSNVFLCKYRMIHICTEELCENYKHDHTGVCAISGYHFTGGGQVSSYDSSDFRTWYAKPDKYMGGGDVVLDARLLLSQSGSAVVSAVPLPAQPAMAPPPPPPPKRRRGLSGLSAAAQPTVPTPRFEVLTDDQIALRAGNWVDLLLFSNKRTEVNRIQQRVFNQRAAEAKKLYIAEQLESQQLPYWTDIYRIVAHHTVGPLPLKEFIYDPQLHAYYVAVIKQVWQRAVKFLQDDPSPDTPCRIDFDDVALGVLFMMRGGMRIRGAEVLPRDDFLLENLPLGIMMPDFGVPKSRMSKCDGLITRIYTRAAEMGATMAELVINVGELPPVFAGAAGTTSRSEKLGSNGEKLFMPSSRKRAQP